MRATKVLIAWALLGIAARAHAQATALDTLPAAVVQRFVDAANARQLDAMMATVAEGAVFGELPDDGHSLNGRDSVRAQYARMLSSLPTGYMVRVVSRIVDGAFVTDLELFAKPDGSPDGQATWIYYVTGGQIQHAWSLRQPHMQPR